MLEDLLPAPSIENATLQNALQMNHLVREILFYLEIKPEDFEGLTIREKIVILELLSKVTKRNDDILKRVQLEEKTDNSSGYKDKLLEKFALMEERTHEKNLP